MISMGADVSYCPRPQADATASPRNTVLTPTSGWTLRLGDLAPALPCARLEDLSELELLGRDAELGADALVDLVAGVSWSTRKRVTAK